MSILRKLSVAALALLAVSMIAGNALAGGDPDPGVPEIDPSSILSAVTLLSGGLLMLNDRRRAK